MGWLVGWESRRHLIDHLLKDNTFENERGAQRVLAHQAAGNNLWTVFEQHVRETGKTERFIVVFLMRGGRNQDWGYKDVSESMGPCEVSCPLKYLDMVPPVGEKPSADGDGPYEWSRRWREAVREYWAQRNAKMARRRAYRRALVADHMRSILRYNETLSPGMRQDAVRTLGCAEVEKIEHEA